MTRARGVGGGVGNLYENMAKQMAAFLDTGLLSQQSRHPKMVEVTLTNLASCLGVTLTTLASWAPGLLFSILTMTTVIMIANVRMFTIIFSCSKVTISLVDSGDPGLVEVLGCDAAGRHMTGGRVQVVLALCSPLDQQKRLHSFPSYMRG